MQPNLRVGEQHPLGAGLGIAFKKSLIVMGEGLPQVALSLRWVAGAQGVTEARDLLGIEHRVIQTRRKETRKFPAYLFIDLEIAPRHGLTSTIQSGERVQHVRNRFL